MEKIMMKSVVLEVNKQQTLSKHGFQDNKGHFLLNDLLCWQRLYSKQRPLTTELYAP